MEVSGTAGAGGGREMRIFQVPPEGQATGCRAPPRSTGYRCWKKPREPRLSRHTPALFLLSFTNDPARQSFRGGSRLEEALILPPAVRPGPWFLTPQWCLSCPLRLAATSSSPSLGLGFLSPPPPEHVKVVLMCGVPICFLPGVSPALENWVEAAGCPGCVARGEELGCLGSAPLSDEMVLLLRPGRGPQDSGACAVEHGRIPVLAEGRTGVRPPRP